MDDEKLYVSAGAVIKRGTTTSIYVDAAACKHGKELMSGILDGTNKEADARLIADVQAAKSEPVYSDVAKAARELGQMQAAVWLYERNYERLAHQLKEAINRGEVNG